jgi:hypothetical protein
MAAIRRMITKARPIRKLIQMGDNTHNQDQVITLVSFSPMNRIVRAPVKLIPLEEEEELLDIGVFRCMSVLYGIMGNL